MYVVIDTVAEFGIAFAIARYNTLKGARIAATKRGGGLRAMHLRIAQRHGYLV